LCCGSIPRLSIQVEFFSIVVEVVEVSEFFLVYGLIHVPVVGLPVAIDFVNIDFALPLFAHYLPFFLERFDEAAEVASTLVNLFEFSICTSNFSFIADDLTVPACD
jgi:hypothetical protein